MGIQFTASRNSCFPSATSQFGGCSGTTDCSSQSFNNIDQFGCPRDRCPDFVIRRHDTKPEFKLMVEDCDGPLDLTGLVLEVNMWSIARLKKDITTDDTYFQLANNVGFNQIMVGDIIIMDQVRRPEHMLVTGFDEKNKYIQVQRGYNGTPTTGWKRGNLMRIFRLLNGVGETEMVFEDTQQTDGTVLKDQLANSFFIYEWQAEDTCLPGCYWLEFKLLKTKSASFFLGGGTWDGPRHVLNNMHMTGSINTDSSVGLSFNPGTETYLLPNNNEWRGPTHLYSEQYYTGSFHDDGSVPLSISGVFTDDDDDTVDALFCSPGISGISIVQPSFTDPSLTPSNFGCFLDSEIEWIRRFPVEGEGFFDQDIMLSYHRNVKGENYADSIRFFN